MNTVMATGWLVKEAWSTTQPRTYRQILCFDLMLAQGDEAAPWRCEIEDEALGRELGPKLLPGTAVMIRGELRTRAFVKQGVKEGFSRWIAVDRLEFSRVRQPAAEPAEASQA